MNYNDLKGFLNDGMLVRLPAKRKKKIVALAWLAEHIPSGRRYTEKEFNALLDRLHTFHDPATLRRELYDFYFIDRDPAGKEYWLTPGRTVPGELPEGICSDAKIKTAADHSEQELKAAADFRNRIHAEALERVRRICPEIESVTDRYEAEDYFQQHWDYPGAWYTIVAVPESAGSREALIDAIVRDTIAAKRLPDRKKNDHSGDQN